MNPAVDLYRQNYNYYFMYMYGQIHISIKSILPQQSGLATYEFKNQKIKLEGTMDECSRRVKAVLLISMVLLYQHTTQ